MCSMREICLANVVSNTCVKPSEVVQKYSMRVSTSSSETSVDWNDAIEAASDAID